MELDITGKVGIENALELLQEEYEDASTLASITNNEDTQEKIGLYMDGLQRAIEIVKLNLPVKTK